MPTNPPSGIITVDVVSQIVDHASKQGDRWLMMALLVVILIAAGWLIKSLSTRLSAVTDRHIEASAKMSEVVANNTAALSRNTEVLDRCRARQPQIA